MDIDVSRLKELTKIAKTEIALQEEERRKERELAEEVHAKQVAEEVIAGIPIFAERKAGAGYNEAAVMELPPSALDAKGSLNGAPKIVFEYCKKQGLNPTLEHREELDMGCLQLVIHW